MVRKVLSSPEARARALRRAQNLTLASAPMVPEVPNSRRGLILEMRRTAGGEPVFFRGGHGRGIGPDGASVAGLLGLMLRQAQ